MTRLPSFLTPLHNSWRRFAVMMFSASLALGVLDACNLDLVLGPLNRMFYDRFAVLSAQPASPEVVLIASNELSLEKPGPWPRTVQASLLDQLTLAHPKAIGLALDYSHPEADGDALLARALKRNGRVVLPVFAVETVTGTAASLPVPLLASAANRLGHMHLAFDHDGMERGVFLCEGKSWPLWPQFALAMLNLGNNPDLDQRAAGVSCASSQTDQAPGFAWLRQHRVGIPFAGGPPRFQRVAYADVLDGTVAPSFFNAKYVIVGATTTGLSDLFSTPLSATNGQLSGSEVHATILNALLEHRVLYRSTWWEAGLLATVPIIVALLGGLYLSPRLALAGTLALAPAYVAFSFWAWHHQYWLPPAAGLFLLALSYLLWSWLRLEAALTYMGNELQRLHQENSFHLEASMTAQGAPRKNYDYVAQRIDQMQRAAARVRDLQSLSHNILESLPEATLVIDHNGKLVTFNRKAAAMFASLQRTLSYGLRLTPLFDGFSEPINGVGTRIEWGQLTTALDASGLAPVQLETHDAASLRDYQLSLSIVRHANGGARGHILVLTDVSALRQAERCREETLQFTSHDMRGPQSSILALLALQRQARYALPMEDLIGRIEKSAQQTLDLAEDLVHMSKAQARHQRLHELDFSALVAETRDDMWSMAKARQVSITLSLPAGMVWVYADRSLLARAVTNLLSNAIKFSHPGGQVELVVQCLPGARVACCVTDHGVGIAQDQQANLFQRFYRSGDQRTAGAGLGLAFVKLVIERLKGTITVHSSEGEGSCFQLILPCMTEEASLETELRH